MNLLHLFNGDSSYDVFKGIYNTNHKAVVWREMLCEGPTLADLNKPEFWDTRAHFLLEFCEISKADYYKKSRDEIKQVLTIDFDEAVLWFEYDLFCQINMIAAISFINSNFPDRKISLICVGRVEKSSELKGLGELSPQAYPQLLKSRTELSKLAIAFACDLWALYCSDDHLALIDKAKEAPVEFEYLRAAFVEHQRRFPKALNGLNYLEESMLLSIKDTAKSKSEIVGEMLKKENYFGFGDLQYFVYLDEMNELYDLIAGKEIEGEKIDLLRLNSSGISILEGRGKFDRVSRPHFFGGCSSEKYYYDSATNRIIEND